jgi:spore germination cell wall hydrolase CwlJ-like protein
MLAEALLCLALNVYHEARGEPVEGRKAVALVTRNRAQQNGHGVCWEVFRYKQFSWTLLPSKTQRVPAGEEWEEAKRIAGKVLAGAVDFTGGATHYHTVSIYPRWAGAMERVGQWGDHVFYRARPRKVYNGGSGIAKRTERINHLKGEPHAQDRVRPLVQ